MNGEYMSLETAKRIKQLETNYKNMQDSALQLDRIVKEKQQEIEKLNSIIEKLEQENVVLKTQAVNKDKYSYGIRMGSDKE